jgi:hypothetical protein
MLAMNPDKYFNFRRKLPMAQAINDTRLFAGANADGASASRVDYQAYQILHVAFIVAPIVAGVEKFFHFLVNWDQYLPPVVNRMVGGHGHELMLAAGVIEIVAGLGVAFKPKVFAYVVSAWLILIVVNLLMIPGYFDIALRDFGLALGALALARLSHQFDR